MNRVDNLVKKLLEDPGVIERFDLDGDGELCDSERELLIRVVRGELARIPNEDAFEFSEGSYEDDRFKILGRVGSGGQGEAYLAVDDTHDEPVVVKLISLSALDDWKTLELFDREADVLAGLDHPGIPDLIGRFSLGEPRYGLGLVQAYVPGKNLQEILEEDGAISEDTLYNVANQLFDILKYIHEQSPPVVHRDIKPSNLILDDNFVLHLIDFGAARDLPRQTGGGSTIVGTHGYMPMEQYMGIARPETDLYAAGVTLLQLLCGKEPSVLPFEENRIRFETVVSESASMYALFEALLEPVAERRLSSSAKAKEMLRRDPRALLRTEAPTPMPLRVPDLVRRFPDWLEVDVQGTMLTFEVSGARKFRIQEEDGAVVILKGAINARITRAVGYGIGFILTVCAILAASTSTLVALVLGALAVVAVVQGHERDGYVRIDYLGVNVPGHGLLPFDRCHMFEARGHQIFLHHDDSSEVEIHVPVEDRTQTQFIVERLNLSLATYRERIGLGRFVQA